MSKNIPNSFYLSEGNILEQPLRTSLTMHVPLDILVVEHDQTSAYALSSLLNQLGYQAEFALSVADALRILDRAPKILLLDLQLPDGSGVEVVREVRARQLKTKVAILGPDVDSKDFEELRSLKPDNTFRKPLDLDRVATWIQNVETTGLE